MIHQTIPRQDMNRFLRHPASHVIALGALSWLVYVLIFGGQVSSNYVIEISEGQVEQMLTRFEMTFKRPPTSQELRSLIEGQIREEVYYREAILLGLEKDDMIIRRRLAQKMDFLSSDLASLAEPTEEAIADFYEKNREDYREPPTVTFSHIYFNVDRRGVLEARDEALILRDRLNAMEEEEIDPRIYGDTFVLQHYFPEYSPMDVERSFGEQEFTDSLFSFEPGAWHGPVVSGYGLHLVLVHDKVESRMPELEEVREKVLSDLKADIRKQANDIFYSGLKSNYEIRFDEAVSEKYDIDQWQSEESVP
jgi:hypothetical protein